MKACLTILLFVGLWSGPAVLADECIEGDCVNGFGTLVTATGQKFIGNFKEGMRHGEGIFICPAAANALLNLKTANEPGRER